MRKLSNLKHRTIAYLFLFSLLGCMRTVGQNNSLDLASKSTGKIYLYGERHAVEDILKKELELWGDFYSNQGFRHLFLETPCYTAELLNVWMYSEDDMILNRIYDDWEGTDNHNPVVKHFFKELKTRFPETVFRGTDIGHQYQTTGKWYLKYLDQQNKKDSEQYQLAIEAIEQGKTYYDRSRDGVYRENMMVANFVREFNNLNNKSIIGIYGSAHTGIKSLDHSRSVPSMANQLHKIYGDQLISVNLNQTAKEVKPTLTEPLRIDNMRLNGTDYKALYFGQQDLSGFKDFAYREFWRLEDAYNDFRNAAKTGDVLPYGNYPMEIQTGQVFVIDYMKIDSTLMRKYYRSDGRVWKNHPSTEEFLIE